MIYRAKIPDDVVDKMKKSGFELIGEVNICKIYRGNSVIIHIYPYELIIRSPCEDSIMSTLVYLGIKKYEKLI